MKRKGISIWEQHLERFVLGAAVLFFVAFTAYQFLGSGNEVELGPRETVAPGEVDVRLRERAQTLLDRLAENAAPELAIPDPAPVAEQFAAAISEPVSPSDAIAPSHARTVMVEGLDAAAPGVKYVVPTIAAPHTVAAVQDFNALDPSVVEQIAVLKERFPERPYDITWMTPVAILDLAAVRNEFERNGSGGETAVPETWWKPKLDILDVRVEREELVDGQWKNRTLLDPLPMPDGVDSPSLRKRLGGDLERPDVLAMRRELLDEARQRAIVQPDFFPLRSGVFTPPDPRAERAEEAQPTHELTDEEIALRKADRQLSRLQARRQAMLDQLVGLGGTLEPPPPVDPGGGDPDGGGGTGGGGGGKKPPGGGPGFGGGGGGKGRRGAGGNAADAAKIKRLQEGIHSIDRQLDRLAERIARMRGGEAEAIVQADQEPVKSLMERDEIRIWAHDIDVEPGRTYRYRFTVDVYNPFFDRQFILLDSQKSLADSVTMASVTSEWSAPQRAIELGRVFITSAKAGDGGRQFEIGQASAEVWRFYDGRWWKHSYTVEPGDRLGRPELDNEQQIDFQTDWFLLDVIPDLDANEEALSRGRAASALLQSVVDPMVTLAQHPNDVLRDLEREQLQDALEDAELAAGDTSGG